MTRLHIKGPNRFYLCPRCRTVRVKEGRPNGTISRVKYHALDTGTLPGEVIQEARALLEPRPEQLSLFEDGT